MAYRCGPDGVERYVVPMSPIQSGGIGAGTGCDNLLCKGKNPDEETPEGISILRATPFGVGSNDWAYRHARGVAPGVRFVYRHPCQ